MTAVVAHAAPAAGRPGLLAWLTTTDHKRIGLLYIVTTIDGVLRARADFQEPVGPGFWDRS